MLRGSICAPFFGYEWFKRRYLLTPHALLWLVSALCIGCAQCTESLNLKDIFPVCHVGRHVGLKLKCQEHDNFLQCNNVRREIAWNVSFSSTTRSNVSHFNSQNAVLTYRDFTSNVIVSEHGVCMYKRKKSLSCYFLSLTDAHQAYTAHNSSSRHKPCSCACAFNSIPDGDITIKHQGKEMSEPRPIIDLIDTTPGSSTKNMVIKFPTNTTYYVRLLKGEEGDCCSPEHKEVMEKNISKDFTCTFYNLNPGKYCVRVTPDSRPDTWCHNTSIPVNGITTVPFPITTEEPSIGKYSQIEFVIIGVACAVVLCVIAWTLRCIVRRRTSKQHFSEAPEEYVIHTSHVSEDRKTIFILYSHDCGEFVDVIQALANFMETNFNCKVSYAKRETDDLQTSPQIWIKEKLSSDIIFVVLSEGACLRHEAWLSGSPLRPRDDVANYETCVFEQLIETLTQNGERSFNYGKVFLISFLFPRTSKQHTLENITPNRLHEIPKDLSELLRFFGLPKIAEETLLTKNDAAYQDLLTSIARCNNFLKNNCDVVVNSLLPVAETNQRLPDRPTLNISLSCPMGYTDFSSSPIFTDESETCPLTATRV